MYLEVAVNNGLAAVPRPALGVSVEELPKAKPNLKAISSLKKYLNFAAPSFKVGVVLNKPPTIPTSAVIVPLVGLKSLVAVVELDT